MSAATTVVPAAGRGVRRDRTGRGMELVLLVFSVGIAMGAYAAVGLAQDGSLPAGMLGYGAGLGVLYALAHLTL